MAGRFDKARRHSLFRFGQRPTGAPATRQQNYCRSGSRLGEFEETSERLTPTNVAAALNGLGGHSHVRDVPARWRRSDGQAVISSYSECVRSCCACRAVRGYRPVPQRRRHFEQPDTRCFGQSHPQGRPAPDSQFGHPRCPWRARRDLPSSRTPSRRARRRRSPATPPLASSARPIRLPSQQTSTAAAWPKRRERQSLQI